MRGQTERADSDRQARELGILNAVAEALNTTLDVQQALRRTLALVAELLGLRTGWIWLLDPESRQFYSAAAQNLPPYLREPIRMTGRSCWCIDSFNAGKLTPKNINMLECSRLHGAVASNDPDAACGLRYHASIPLYFQNRPLGIMNVTGPSWRELSEEELRLLSTIAYQVGIAIERARLAEESTGLARAEERTRLAREIHDTLAQGLTAIILHLEGALPHIEGKPERSRERIEAALGMARESLEEARRSVLDLRAAPLENRPLAEALASLARTFTAQTGIRVHVEATGETAASPQSLPLRVEGELYRIVQEALANVRRHSRAQDVTIQLMRRESDVRLVLYDNGCGFDPRRVGAGSQGIVGMRERARLIGGILRLRSRPDHGTRIEVMAPLGMTE